jgi:hypothetical protein
MMRDGYFALWRGREYEASPDGDEVRIYATEAEDGFEEVREHRHRRIVPLKEIEDIWYVRTSATWRGEPFLILAEHDAWLRVEYTGGKAPVARALDLEEFDYGVYQGWAPAAEVTDIREHRV